MNKTTHTQSQMSSSFNGCRNHNF